MASFSDLWNELVHKFFASFAPQEPALTDISRPSPRPSPESPPQTTRGETYAAPCSVYDSRRGAPDYFSSGVQNGSVCAAGSVCAPSVCENGQSLKALRSFAMPEAERPMPVSESVHYCPRPESVIIPFKDGSSQIITRGLQGADPQLRLKGASFLLSEAYKARDAQFFISDPEDVVDVKVAEYFKTNPQVYTDTKLTRIRPGSYSMKRDGCPSKEIKVEWFWKGHEGQLQVTDGALVKPFADYFFKKDTNSPTKYAPTSQYNGSIFKAKNNLQTIPKECRVTFNDAGFDYSRIDAMKVAKEQALLREDVAKMMTQDRQVPHLQRIESRYEKQMDLKLGVGTGPRTRRHTQVSIPTTPSFQRHTPPPSFQRQQPGGSCNMPMSPGHPSGHSQNGSRGTVKMSPGGYLR